MVRWLRWHCPPDTGFEIRALAVWGRARYLSVTEAPHNTDFHTWMGKKHFCFFQTAETGNRTPNSGVKGSGANHYPRAPALSADNGGSDALQMMIRLDYLWEHITIFETHHISWLNGTRKPHEYWNTKLKKMSGKFECYLMMGAYITSWKISSLFLRVVTTFKFTYIIVWSVVWCDTFKLTFIRLPCLSHLILVRLVLYYYFKWL